MMRRARITEGESWRSQASKSVSEHRLAEGADRQRGDRQRRAASAEMKLRWVTRDPAHGAARPAVAVVLQLEDPRAPGRPRGRTSAATKNAFKRNQPGEGHKLQVRGSSAGVRLLGASVVVQADRREIVSRACRSSPTRNVCFYSPPSCRSSTARSRASRRSTEQKGCRSTGPLKPVHGPASTAARSVMSVHSSCAPTGPADAALRGRRSRVKVNVAHVAAA